MLQLVRRDRDLLQLLDQTPATPPLILKASSSFVGGPFHDERRVRERAQRLIHERLVRGFSSAITSGGAKNYYKLTPAGFSALYGDEVALPPRAYFGEIPLSRVEHTLGLAEAIVHTLVAAHRYRIRVTKFHREGELALNVGPYSQQPDFHVQLGQAGKTFNILVEFDRGTESVDSQFDQSIRQKILGYEGYQDLVWRQWKQEARKGSRPFFKVAFLTTSVSRAYHILALARTLARNPDRRLCIATTAAEFLASDNVLNEPIFLDHNGNWQAIVDLHPTATFGREKVRLPENVESPFALW